MKILVLSDSHGHLELMYKVLDILDEKIKAVLFMGDCVDDIIDYAYCHENKRVFYVVGNCDMNYTKPSDLVTEINSKKIFMTHGDKYGIKSGHERLVFKAKSEGVDVCLFGHTHSPEIFEESGIFFMNPGSIALPRGISYHPTYGIINVENDSISGKIMEIRKGAFKEFKF